MTGDKYNLYNDTFIPTTGSHGANIAAQRVDELDDASLQFVKQTVAQKGSCCAVDIGGAMGIHSRRMAKAGANVTLIDLVDQTKGLIADTNAELGREAIRFIQGDVRTLDPALRPDGVDAVYSQRMLSFIPYPDAVRMIEAVRPHVKEGGRFFLSAAGLNSELGQGYVDAGRPVAQRFGPLAPAIAQKNLMTNPVCLYTVDEFTAMLEKAGLKVERAWASEFGNVKAIAAL